MNCEKVVSCKYSLDTDEINGLKQAKITFQGICNLFDHQCEDCPLESNCIGPCDFDALINNIINSSDEYYRHERINEV